MTSLLPMGLPPPRDGRCDVLILAGEHSGDQQAARMLAGFRRVRPDAAVCALGGTALEGEGAQLLHDLTATSVVGLVEVLKNYRYFRNLFGAVVSWIETHRPGVVCLVDYPGFNLRLAAELKRRGVSLKGGGGVRVVQYISPQIWAWKAGRRFRMAETLDALAVIFPFEPACYADAELPVEFVGHPFAAADYRSPVRFDPDGPILLLPGSRRQAVGRIFPRLIAGYDDFVARRAGKNAVVLYPDAGFREHLEGLLAGAVRGPGEIRLAPVGERVAASAVLTSSGTMSLNCALAGIPGAIAYRANPLTYWIGRRVVKVKYLGIANLLLDREMYPEFIQGAATAKNLAAALERALEDPAARQSTTRDADELRKLLSEPAGRDAGAWLAEKLEE